MKVVIIAISTIMENSGKCIAGIDGLVEYDLFVAPVSWSEVKLKFDLSDPTTSSA